MKKQIFKLLGATTLLLAIVAICTPYFTTGYLDLRQKEENNKNYLKMLEEERLAKEALERAYLLGKFDPAKRKGFVIIPREYTLTPFNIYLRQETLEAFLEMRNAALLDKVDIKITSAARNFDYQKMLWNNKWTGITFVDGKDLSKTMPDGNKRFRKILEYSAAPGASRHHWGTDIDINSATPSYFQAGKGKEEYEWLAKNAGKFGFCQTYNLKGSSRPTGYNEEKWHWSYIPLASDLTKKYEKLVTDKDITGFMGDEYVAQQNLIKDYVLGINPDCL